MTYCLRAIACLVAGLLLVGWPVAARVSAAVPAVQRMAQGLVLSLSVGRREFSKGQRVEVTLKLRNDRATPITLVVHSGQLFDLLIYNARGVKCWAWMESRPFPQAPPELRTLKPGDTVSGTLVWDQMILRAPFQLAGKATPGKYFLEGVLRATVQEMPQLRLRTSRISIVIRP